MIDSLKAKFSLTKLQDSENINELLDEEQSSAVGLKIKSTYEADQSSRQRWETKMQDATDLALQLKEDKTYPWPNAANVKFPLVTIAAMQFAARAYPALVKAPDLVKWRVQGKDDGMKAARAERISSHMSYQLLEQDEGWEEDQDKALIALPILGCVFKKSYYDKSKGHNVSKLVLPKNLVVHYYAKSLEDCERKTEVFQLSPRQIKERELRGIFSVVELHGTALPEPDSADKRQGISAPFDDTDRPRTLLEQHCYLDLDGDGYKEPYIVTVDRDTAKVLRIVNRFGELTTEQSVKIEELQKRMKMFAEGLQGEEDVNILTQAEQTILKMQAEVEMLAEQKPKVLKIQAVEHYTKYSFIPSPDGGFYDLGFGALLGPLNDSVNTLLNQLIDSGSLSNGGIGFIGKGARIRGGKVRFSPNEWKKVDVPGSALRDNIVPLPVNQPSPVLFNLLSLLISYSERVGSVTDAMTGENPGQNTPAYNMSAMLEQGLQVFNGVFKRVYRSMRSEFRKLYNLNGIYLDQEEYISYQDSDITVLRSDYTGDDNALIPAADPNAFSNEEKIKKAQMIAERAQMVPGYDPIVIERRFLEAADIADAAEVFPLQANPETGRMEYVFPPQPDPELELDKAELQQRVLTDQRKGEIDTAVAESTIALNEGKLVLLIAQARKLGADDEVARLELSLATLIESRERLVAVATLEIEREEVDVKRIAAKKPTGAGTAS